MKDKTTQTTFDLAGKVCVVIGAGLIGSEYARRLALHNATVVVADLDTQKGEELAKEIGGTFIACDATKVASVKNLVAEVVQTCGKVDGVVNAVYLRTKTHGMHFEDLPYESFLEEVGLQSGPQFLTAREFGAVMKKQGNGSIVFVGSIYGATAPRFELYEGSTIKPPAVEYAVAKGGLATLTRYLAKYYAPFGVRVNMLSPGGVWNHQDKVFEEKFSQHAILGNRMAVPEDLSPALVYLLSDASGYMTGQNLTIDGGWTL